MTNAALQPKASNRQIAKVLGADERTVRRDTAAIAAATAKTTNKINEQKASAAANAAPVLAGAAAAQLVQRKERAEEQRERRREQQRRHRQRQSEGRRVYAVELDGDIVDLLVRLNYLDKGAVADDQEVARAARRALVDAAKATTLRENNS
jgi:hypothetical protein